jgi:hypothetical protein
MNLICVFAFKSFKKQRPQGGGNKFQTKVRIDLQKSDTEDKRTSIRGYIISVIIYLVVIIYII